jgi:hypothetical protein
MNEPSDNSGALTAPEKSGSGKGASATPDGVTKDDNM